MVGGRAAVAFRKYEETGVIESVARRKEARSNGPRLKKEPRLLGGVRRKKKDRGDQNFQQK